MQINDLFGRAAAFETARLPDGTAAVLPAEHAAALYVNEQPAFRVVCTPELLPQLALGRLLTEGWITSAQEVGNIPIFKNRRIHFHTVGFGSSVAVCIVTVDTSVVHNRPIPAFNIFNRIFIISATLMDNLSSQNT